MWAASGTANVIPSHAPELVSSRHQPGLGELLHPGAGYRHRLPDEVQPVVAHPQGCECRSQVPLHAFTAKSFSSAGAAANSTSRSERPGRRADGPGTPCWRAAARPQCRRHRDRSVRRGIRGRRWVDPSPDVSRFGELRDEPRHRRLADLLHAGELAEPKHAVLFDGGERARSGMRSVPFGRACATAATAGGSTGSVLRRWTLPRERGTRSTSSPGLVRTAYYTV